MPWRHRPLVLLLPQRVLPRPARGLHLLRPMYVLSSFEHFSRLALERIVPDDLLFPMWNV